jgi:hypothetical protein
MGTLFFDVNLYNHREEMIMKTYTRPFSAAPAGLRDSLLKSTDQHARWLTGVLLGLTFLAGCTTLRTGSDFDRTTRFSQFHTYEWLPRNHLASHNPLIVRHAHEAIDSEMLSKGFVPAEDGHPADFVIDFTIGSHERIDVQSYPAPYSTTWGWGQRYYGEQIDVRRYREGVLAIDVFDGVSHQPIWTGWATKKLTQSDMEDSAGPIRTAASAVLAAFPPQ